MNNIIKKFLGGNIPIFQKGGRIDFPGRKYANPYLVPEHNIPKVDNTILPDVNRAQAFGTNASEYKIGVGFDGKQTQIPRVVGGEILSPEGAITRHKLTGEKFKYQANPSSYSRFYDIVSRLGILKPISRKQQGGNMPSRQLQEVEVKGVSNNFNNQRRMYADSLSAYNNSIEKNAAYQDSLAFHNWGEKEHEMYKSLVDKDPGLSNYELNEITNTTSQDDKRLINDALNRLRLKPESYSYNNYWHGDGINGVKSRGFFPRFKKPTQPSEIYTKPTGAGIPQQHINKAQSKNITNTVNTKIQDRPITTPQINPLRYRRTRDKDKGFGFKVSDGTFLNPKEMFDLNIKKPNYGGGNF